MFLLDYAFLLPFSFLFPDSFYVKYLPFLEQSRRNHTKSFGPLSLMWKNWASECWSFFDHAAWEILGLLFTCGVQASHWGDFSCYRAKALGHTGFSSCSFSSCSSPALEHRLNSCSAWLSCSMPCGSSRTSAQICVSCHLAGGLFPAEPPGKPS